jgi:hypothetical protein
MSGDASAAHEIPAHERVTSHRYMVHYPAHFARESDPHYVDFHAFHRKYGPDARCEFAIHANTGAGGRRRTWR